MQKPRTINKTSYGKYSTSYSYVAKPSPKERFFATVVGVRRQGLGQAETTYTVKDGSGVSHHSLPRGQLMADFNRVPPCTVHQHSIYDQCRSCLQRVDLLESLGKALPKTAADTDIGKLDVHGAYISSETKVSEFEDEKSERPLRSVDELQVRVFGAAEEWLLQQQRQDETEHAMEDVLAQQLSVIAAQFKSDAWLQLSAKGPPGQAAGSGADQASAEADSAAEQVMPNLLRQHMAEKEQHFAQMRQQRPDVLTLGVRYFGEDKQLEAPDTFEEEGQGSEMRAETSKAENSTMVEVEVCGKAKVAAGAGSAPNTWHVRVDLLADVQASASQLAIGVRCETQGAKVSKISLAAKEHPIRANDVISVAVRPGAEDGAEDGSRDGTIVFSRNGTQIKEAAYLGAVSLCVTLNGRREKKTERATTRTNDAVTILSLSELQAHIRSQQAHAEASFPVAADPREPSLAEQAEDQSAREHSGELAAFIAETTREADELEKEIRAREVRAVEVASKEMWLKFQHMSVDEEREHIWQSYQQRCQRSKQDLRLEAAQRRLEMQLRQARPAPLSRSWVVFKPPSQTRTRHCAC